MKHDEKTLGRGRKDRVTSKKEGKKERKKDKERKIKTSRVVLRQRESWSRASITSFPRLKGAGQWRAPGSLTRPKAAGYLDRFECQQRKPQTSKLKIRTKQNFDLLQIKRDTIVWLYRVSVK